MEARETECQFQRAALKSPNFPMAPQTNFDDKLWQVNFAGGEGKWSVGLEVTLLSLERKVRSSNLGQVKSDTVLPTIRYRCDISSKGAVLPGSIKEEVGLVNSLRASSEYNKKFDLILKTCFRQKDGFFWAK